MPVVFNMVRPRKLTDEERAAKVDTYQRLVAFNATHPLGCLMWLAEFYPGCRSVDEADTLLRYALRGCKLSMTAWGRIAQALDAVEGKQMPAPKPKSEQHKEPPKPRCIMCGAEITDGKTAKYCTACRKIVRGDASRRRAAERRAAAEGVVQ